MTRTMLMVMTLLVGCATGAVVREVVAPARAQGQVGPNYEYQSVDLTNPAAQEINGITAKFGAQGFRLAAALPRGDHWATLIFERQLPAH
jgi:hypothetical protein